jgi:pyrroline-5-carboxylate reductase
LKVIEIFRKIALAIKQKIVISTAALIPLRAYKQILGDAEIYRAMPNICVEINKGFIPICGNKKENAEAVEKILGLLGEVEWVDEDTLDKFTLLSASIPALITEIIDAMELAALELGIPNELSKKAIRNVLIGTAELYREKDLIAIRNDIATPKGITIKLLLNSLRSNVKLSIIDTLINTSKELDNLINYYDKIIKLNL